jgi:AcrR family transcriptional regulator
MTPMAEPSRAISRPTEATRRALVEAATGIFAEHGYERGSVRLITSAAGANQAAITYHFGGKDGLYREVLRAAIRAFEEQSLVDDTTPDTASAEEALRLLVRQLLVPLVKRDRLSRYMRIFAWESAEPSRVFAEFMAHETPPVFRITERIVRRFLPDDALPEEVALTVFWVIEQPIAIVRNAERLAAPPFNLPLQGPGAVNALVDRLTRLCLGGLASRRPRGAQI